MNPHVLKVAKVNRPWPTVIAQSLDDNDLLALMQAMNAEARKRALAAEAMQRGGILS